MTDSPSQIQAKSTKLALSLFFELGYIIALPAVALGFGGAYVDKWLGTTPLLTIVGLLLALTASILWVWKTIQKISTAGNPRS